MRNSFRMFKKQLRGMHKHFLAFPHILRSMARLFLLTDIRAVKGREGVILSTGIHSHWGKAVEGKFKNRAEAKPFLSYLEWWNRDAKVARFYTPYVDGIHPLAYPLRAILFSSAFHFFAKDILSHKEPAQRWRKVFEDALTLHASLSADKSIEDTLANLKGYPDYSSPERDNHVRHYMATPLSNHMLAVKRVASGKTEGEWELPLPPESVLPLFRAIHDLNPPYDEVKGVRDTFYEAVLSQLSNNLKAFLLLVGALSFAERVYKERQCLFPTFQTYVNTYSLHHVLNFLYEGDVFLYNPPQELIYNLSHHGYKAEML